MLLAIGQLGNTPDCGETWERITYIENKTGKQCGTYFMTVYLFTMKRNLITIWCNHWQGLFSALKHDKKIPGNCFPSKRQLYICRFSVLLNAKFPSTTYVGIYKYPCSLFSPKHKENFLTTEIDARFSCLCTLLGYNNFPRLLNNSGHYLSLVHRSRIFSLVSRPDKAVFLVSGTLNHWDKKVYKQILCAHRFTRKYLPPGWFVIRRLWSVFATSGTTFFLLDTKNSKKRSSTWIRNKPAMDSAAFRKYGKEMVDFVADYWDSMRDRTPLPDVQPGYAREMVDDYQVY